MHSNTLITNDLNSCVDFLQRLIRVESLPGREGPLATLVLREMQRLGYDDVRTDDAGNVIGMIRGRGAAPPLMFNTHLDHVDVGDPSGWPYPPFEATVHDGKVWGRGAMDIKGPLAAQVHGIAQLVAQGTRPPGDVYVTGVVQEEVGGVGAAHLLTHLRPPLVVVGEASRNQLRRGHRGRTELTLHVQGKSVHASVPDRGVNPLHVVARFVSGLNDLPMRHHPDLGTASVAPTLIRTDQTSGNVVPAETWLTCDWRNVADETEEEARSALQQLADRSVISGATAQVEIRVGEHTTYTGYRSTMAAHMPPYVIAADHPAVRAARRILAEAIQLQGEPGVWRFATDGGHFARAALTVIGFGPGDEAVAHTNREHIDVSQLETAMAGNRALALHWASSAAA